MKFTFFTILLMATCFMVHAINMDTYIINGDNSPAVRFYAYIEIFKQRNYGGQIFFGGGTLISSYHVLTVAQNVARFKAWRIGLGANSISQMHWVESTEAEIYPDYDNSTLAHNIAIIRLATAAPNFDSIAPIVRIPVPGIPGGNGGESYHIAGFGFGTVDHQPDVLQHAELTVVSRDDCGIAYPHLISSGQLSNYFCARNRTTHSNICAGDQGGPIYSRQLNMLIGIQSFNRIEDCGDGASQPPAFIRVAPYNGWINSFR